MCEDTITKASRSGSPDCPARASRPSADRAAEILKERGYHVERLDGDIVRQDLTRDLGFSKADRDENIRRVTFVSKLLTRNGVIVLTSFISPYAEDARPGPQGDRRVSSRSTPSARSTSASSATSRACTRRPSPARSRSSPASPIPTRSRVQPELVLETDKETLEESTGPSSWPALKDGGYLD